MSKVIIHGALHDTTTQQAIRTLNQTASPECVIVLASVACKDSFLYKHCGSFKSVVDGKLEGDYKLYFCRDGECGLPTRDVAWI